MKTQQRTRIEQLKQQIRETAGFDPVFGTADDCPPDIEEAFLEGVLKYEKLSREVLRDRLAAAGIVLSDPVEFDEAELSRKLWEAINALVSMSIVPVNTDHLSDREVYTRLWEISVRSEIGVAPHFFSRGWYIDFIDQGEHGVDIYLKYYASDAERRDFHERFPDRQLPEHCDPQHDRDRLIPDL